MQSHFVAFLKLNLESRSTSDFFFLLLLKIIFSDFRVFPKSYTWNAKPKWWHLWWQILDTCASLTRTCIFSLSMGTRWVRPHDQMESSLSTAAFALCSLPCEPDFTITLFSHFGGGQNYLPYPFRHACIYQALCVILCNLSLSSSALFSVILGLLALSVLKRNPTPPDFSKGSLEFINLFAWRHSDVYEE